MKIWHVYSFLSLIFYGLWAFFPKIATRSLEPKSILVYQTIGIFLVSLYFFKFYHGEISVDTKGIIFSVLTGASGVIGTFFFINALKVGKASVVITITALYPLFAILLVFFILKEIPTQRQILGMLFALVALYLFAKT